jgi:hypothetical protein
MNARLIAYYLPQFYPIPENDETWGKGFTEWINVAKAKPQFKGHDQPRIPADLGFYDLRVPEVREEQAELARESGIEGFIYWHYWMGNGKKLLQRPFEEVLTSGKPDFPFCLAWANHDWKTSTWVHGEGNKMIYPMVYGGVKDYTDHFNYVLPAFKDHRYITVDGKPLFVVYDPYAFKDVSNFLKTWRKLASENGLKGIYFVALMNNTSTIRRDAQGNITRVIPNLKSSKEVYDHILSLGFDGINSYGKARGEMIYQGMYRRNIKKLLHQVFSFLPAQTFDYPKVVPYFFAPEDAWDNVFPCVLANWDRTPRAGSSEGVYVNSTPKNFKKHLEQAIELIKDKPDQHKILFLRSWNEWGEGNYVEPDQTWGHGYLDAIKEALIE